MENTQKKRILLSLATGTAIGLLFALLQLSGLLIRLEERNSQGLFWLDSLLRGWGHPHPAIVLVAVDDYSLGWLGKWPWPASLHEKLLGKLDLHGAYLIGYDFLFPEGSFSPAKEKELAGKLSQTKKVVLPFHLESSLNRQKAGKDSFLWPAPPLLKAAAGLGFNNLAPNSSRLLLKTPLIHPAGGKVYPSFALACFLKCQGEAAGEITFSPKEKKLSLGNKSIPLNSRGELLIHYLRPPPTFPTYSFSQVTAGRLTKKNPQAFQDKIVLVGTTASSLQKTFSTPYSPERGSLEIQATILHNLLTGDFLRPLSGPASLALIIFLGILSALAASFLRPGQALGLVVLLVLLSGLLAVYFFSWKNIIIPLGALVLVIPTSCLGTLLAQSLAQKKGKGKIIRPLKSFIPASAWEKILVLASKGGVNLQGEKKEVSLLYLHLPGVNRLAASEPSKDTLEQLNHYWEIVRKKIFQGNGSIAFISGDSLLAFWGAPLPLRHHPQAAARTALEIISLEKELPEGYRQAFQARISLDKGQVLAGFLGPEGKTHYGIIGKKVRDARHLNHLTSHYKTRIIISGSFEEKLSEDFFCRLLDLVAKKDTPGNEKVFELRKAPSHREKEALEAFSHGLKFYWQRQWNKAIEQFQKTLSLLPEDGPAALFISRCIQFKEKPPPISWEGVSHRMV